MINRTKRIHEDASNPEFIDVVLNITKMSEKYDVDFNKLSSDLSSYADSVDGTIREDGLVIMRIKHIDEQDLEDVLVDKYGMSPRDVHSYIYSEDDELEECGDFDIEECGEFGIDECGDECEDDEFKVEECGDEFSLDEGIKVQNPRKRGGNPRKKLHEDLDEGDLTPVTVKLYAIEDAYGPDVKDAVYDVIDRSTYPFKIYALRRGKVARSLKALADEAFYNLRDEVIAAGVPEEDVDTVVYDGYMSESLKAPAPVLQAKVDKSEAALNDIIAKVKEEDLDEATAKAACKKLHKEVSNLKNYGVDPKRVAGIKSTIAKLAKTDPSLKQILEGGSCELIIAKMMKKSRTLHDDVKLNGKKMSSISTVSLNEALKKIAEMMRELTGKLNESASLADAEKVAKLTKLRKSIIEEIDYRTYMFKKLNEAEDEAEAKDEDEPKETSAKAIPEDVEKDEEVELSEIVFTFKDDKAADDFIEACKDADIPEDVFAKEDLEEEKREDDKKEDEAEDEEKNESAKSSGDSKHLNEEGEDEESSEEDADSEGDDASDNEENTKKDDKPKEVKVRLLDVDYTSKVIDVLDSVYGISKEEFEKMIGGEIVDDEEASSDEGEEKDKENDEEDAEDEVSPEDIFKDL